MAYNLIEHTEEHLTRPKIRGKNTIHYYPSEASVKVTDANGMETVHGTCLRQAYFRCMGIQGQPYSANSEFIFRLGKATEEMLVEEWKQMGIWRENNIRWYDPEYNLSGEADAILVEPGGPLYGVEVKSFYGYFMESELFGSKGKLGFPKMGHLLQTLVYQHEFPYLEHFKIVYMGRDKARRIEFKVKLVCDELQDGSIVHRPEVNGTAIMDFTMEDVLQRYRDLDTAVRSQTPPPKEFDLKYSKEKIEQMRQAGNMSTLKYNKWLKCKSSTNKDWPGDWNCRYCKFENICWDSAGNPKTIAPAEGQDLADTILE